MGIPSELQYSIEYSIEKSKALVRGYFAHREVYPGELPGIMRKHIYTGVMGSTYFSLISGLFFVYYANSIGLTRPLWGLMGGISAVAIASQILSAFVTERLRRRKLLWFVSALAGRVLRVLALFACLWLWHAQSPLTAWVLIGGMCASDFLDAMAGPPWLSWLADIIPADRQGGFWGRRSAWIAFAMMCVLIPAGYIMDEVPAQHKMTMVLSVFAAAGVIGIIDLFIHGTLPEPELDSVDPEPFVKRLIVPLRDKRFRPWLIFNMAWTAGMTLGGWLGVLYFLEELGLKHNFLGGMIVLNAMSQLGSVLVGSWSGRLVDRIGCKRVLTWGHFFWAILPIYWVFATPATAVWWLGWSSISGSAGAAAATTAANKLITRIPEQRDRAMYVALSACLANVASGVGVLTAGAVLKAFGETQWTVLGWTFGAFQALFMASFVLRMTCARVLLPRVQEPEAEPVTESAAVAEGEAA